MAQRRGQRRRARASVGAGTLALSAFMHAHTVVRG